MLVEKEETRVVRQRRRNRLRVRHRREEMQAGVELLTRSVDHALGYSFEKSGAVQLKPREFVCGRPGTRMRVAERHRLRSSVAPPTVIPTLERPLSIIMAVRENSEISNPSMCLIGKRQF